MPRLEEDYGRERGSPDSALLAQAIMRARLAQNQPPQAPGLGQGTLDPEMLARMARLGQFGQSATIPQAPVLPVQYPQVQPQQMPPALPQVFGQGAGTMPMMRSRMMANVMGPLMQPNYGMPIIGRGYGLPQPSGMGLGGPTVPYPNDPRLSDPFAQAATRVMGANSPQAFDAWMNMGTGRRGQASPATGIARQALR